MVHLDLKWDGMLRLFFNYPSKKFQIRELSRLSRIPKTTVQRVVQHLHKKKIITVKKGMVFPFYQADETSFWYIFYKKNYLLEEIYASGLIDFLERHFQPRCIYLFGSGAKGDYTVSSDLDLFVLCSEKEEALEIYERKLKRKINLLLKKDVQELSPELLNNIFNGTKLYGYLKLK